LAIEIPCYLIGVVFIEWIKANPNVYNACSQLFWGVMYGRCCSAAPDLSPPADEDIDVTNERNRVLNSDHKDIVTLHGVSMTYSNGFTAVKPLHFGIPEGQCFGFLGVNGAGKTTTLKILSMDHAPTTGTATLNGFDLLTQQTQVRRGLGYCPQFDALLPTLTGRETLYLYARIKGMPEDQLEYYSTQIIERLGLTDVITAHARHEII
jgi:ABC-type uncharacterized transport system ATPase subunit